MNIRLESLTVAFLYFSHSSFPRREDVDSANALRLARLSGEKRTFHAEDAGSASNERRKKLLSNFMAPEVLQLAQDAQVMLIKNCDGALVNGSMGRVAGFVDPSEYVDGAAYETRPADDRGSDNFTVHADSSRSTPKEGIPKWPLVEFAVPGGKGRLWSLRRHGG